jgi:plastocyanin
MMRRSLIALVAAALLIASGCAAGSGGRPRAEAAAPAAASADGVVKTTSVELPKSYKFSPSVIQIEPGDVVTWTNNDDFPHTVRLKDGSEPDKPVSVGKSISIDFEKTGIYRYDCSLHPTQMQGKVLVEEPSR